MSLVPVGFYGLEVPSGDVLISGADDYPASFRITMAAIDPSAEPHLVEPTGNSLSPRATLKIVRRPPGLDDDESDEDSDSLRALLGDNGLDIEDDDGSDDDEEVNGGPSDPSKSKRARRAKEIADLKKAMEDEEDEDVDMETMRPNGVNGTSPKKGKGKAKATGEDLDVDDVDDDEDDEDDEGLDLEEFVVCTLDPAKQYQQPLDITVGEDEIVYFKVSGTHAVYLTGNYVLPAEDAFNDGADRYDTGEEDDYDLSPDDDELYDEEESDELDDLSDPRITELGTEDEDDEEDEGVPKLVKKDDKKKPGSDEKKKKAESPKPDDTQKEKKAKNKRAADDDENEANLDDIMAKALKPAEGAPASDQPKLSKKQLKKLKNNAGQAVPPATQDNTVKKDEKPGSAKSDKKVQFAKDLESPGKAGEKSGNKSNGKREAEKTGAPKATLGIKTVQGVIIDDKKLGTGPPAKKGDTVSLRYIGKLQSNNMQFDANKGAGTDPFKFKIGAGQVIKGWDIGVEGMSVRGERRITVPPHLGYGKKPYGKIPPNSTLIFEVKLLSIN